MKNIFCSLTLMFSITYTHAQLSLDTSQHTLAIAHNNIIRLINGIGVTALNKKVVVKSSIKNDVVLLHLNVQDAIDANEFAGVFFDNIPNLKQGLTIWRYKPWNSWTKPISITDATKMQDWDVQFFYWQYNDGLYGAAVPLSGNGFRTTLGSNNYKWGSKAVSYASNTSLKDIPSMSIAFGKDPYELFNRIYKTSVEAMGKTENESAKKILPEPFQYIGWCTWNSSNMGKDLNEQHIIDGVKTFTDKKFPLGWVLIDDGWLQNSNSQLQAFQPDTIKFPNGFKPLIGTLKNRYGIKYVGAWHAFDGYWNGIDPNSFLGIKYKNQLFSWSQKQNVSDDSSPVKTYYFIKPEADNLYKFYNTWHTYLKSEGIDFVKVDNQLVAERMAVNHYPLFNLSAKMHEALNASVNKYFNGAVINCMDMTADAYFNFGSSAVARSVEDYFPYEKDETYNLQKGNAAAHVLQSVYNALYFSQMVYPDFDMFESHNPNAVFHAIARILNNGPIYLTDKPGEQNFNILNRIVFADGRTIHSSTSLLPTEDCLFQVQDAKLFKAYSMVKNTGLLALYNAADTDKVTGSFKAADVHGLKGEEFALYEYFSGDLKLAKRDDTFSVSLPRMGYKLQYIVPVINGFAPFGLINKYNAPATILNVSYISRNTSVTLYEGGNFKAYCKKKPVEILLNGKKQQFNYNGKTISLNIPEQVKKPVLIFKW